MYMADKKSKPVEKSVERPFYGSQEKPVHESVSAPTNSGSGIKTGKPRPPSND